MRRGTRDVTWILSGGGSGGGGSGGGGGGGVPMLPLLEVAAPDGSGGKIVARWWEGSRGGSGDG